MEITRTMTTEQKILSFGNFGKDWARKFKKEDLELAVSLNKEMISAGFSITDAFPGLDGEVCVALYTDRICAFFTLTKGLWDYYLENDVAEIEEFSKKTFQECVGKIKDLAAEYL